jgi:hypothetical protein
MRMTLTGYAAALTLAFASHAGAATIPAANCSADAVQAAINSANNGDTVTIPAGTCTWTKMVTIPDTKGITLQGAGIDSTILANGLSGLVRMFDIYVKGGNALTRVTGLTLDARFTSGTSLGEQLQVMGLGVDRFRLDHLKIKNIRFRGILVVAANGGELSGLIDSNVFECPMDYSCHGVDIIGSWPGGGTTFEVNAPFSRPFELGSNKAIYIENNFFDFAYPNDGAIDGFGGIQIVFRYNNVKNAMVGWHGADSAAYRGPHWFEVYGNTFTDTGTAPGATFFYRGGTGVQFDNRWTSAHGRFTNGAISIYRARPETFGSWGQCDGSSPWDGNRGTAGVNPGWPCLDQLGWVFGASPGATPTLVPSYFWNDRINGNFSTFTTYESGRENMSNWMKENREYYTEKSGFNGTSGVGVGPLSGRPATCTAGVGYWATDQGSLYTCTGTNSWSHYYSPYPYPHPLTSGGSSSTSSTGGPPPPGNIRIVY